MYFDSATCFDLTVGYNQAIQIVYNIKEMDKVVLSELKSHFYNVFTKFQYKCCLHKNSS